MSATAIATDLASRGPIGGPVAPIIPAAERRLSGRVTLRRTLADTLTMAWRHLIKMIRTPEQFFDVALQPVIFILMFTYIFGGAIAGDTKTYLPFLLPGILVQSVISTSMATGSQLREDMDKGVFDRFKSLPMARIAPLSGALVGDLLRYVLATIVSLIVGMAIGYRPQGGALGVISASLLVIVVAWAMSWIFALLGVTLRSAGAVTGVGMALIMPLTMISSAFVPAETMPSGLQSFIKVNPISHLVTAARDLMTTGHWGFDIVWSLVGAGVIVAIFAPLTLHSYKRRV
jgi:ABC-2 type transport system permease protein